MKIKLLLITSVVMFLLITSVVMFLPLFLTAPSYNAESYYTPWGIEEYQLLGLNKNELSKVFKGRLFFSKDFKRATFSEKGTGLGYQGAVFNLSFNDGKVSSVQGIFEGCTQKYKRPRFNSKKAALIYSINNLSSYKGAKEQESLKQAKQALAELKNASKSESK